MYNDLKYYINDMKRRINSHREAVNKIKPELLLEKTGPLETASIYFQVIEFNYYIKGLIDLRNEYKLLNLFRTPFEEKDYIPVNTLWLTAENIDRDKDNFCTFMDLDFLKSKDRTIRLWDCDIPGIIDLYEETLDTLEGYIDGAADTWYDMYKHLEGPRFFLDKDTMTMYQMTNYTEDETFSDFRFDILVYDEDLKPSKTKNNFNPEGVLPEFIERMLSRYYPEYLLSFLLFINICIFKVGVFSGTGIII